jgi:hypothetical protein
MAVFLNKGKNYLINGAMDFWQRSTSTSLTNGYVAPDRWRFYRLGSNTLTVSRSTDVPTIQESGFKFNFSTLITVTTAQASLTGTDGVRILQNIEGNIFKPLAGKDQTLSFWIKTSRVGNYAVSFANGSADRCLVSLITVNQANTWEKKSISFSHNTLGTWNYDTSTGMSVSLSLADSPTYQSSVLNNWVAGSFFSHSSCVNFVSNVGSTIYLTGFQLEEGNSSTNFSLAGGLIPQELQLCQRYFCKSFRLDTTPANNTGIIDAVPVGGTFSTAANTSSWAFNFPVEMRTDYPMVSVFNPFSITGNTFALAGSGSNALNQYLLNRTGVIYRNTNLVTVSQINMCYTADAEL